MNRTILSLLAVLTACAALTSLSGGAMSISFSNVLSVLGTRIGWTPASQPDAAATAVVMSIRLPRVIGGLLIGASLAAAGAALQGMFRNPLADPGLIGVSAGAALGAMTMIVLGPALLSTLPLIAAMQLGVANVLPFAAFAGGLVTTWIVYRLAARSGYTSTATLLLAGIAIAATASAGTGFLTYLANDNQLRTLTFWNLGSLGAITWDRLYLVSGVLVVGTGYIVTHARALDAMLLGESEATHLGINVEQVKRRLLITVALVVGCAVSISGIIGFIGLVTPHLIRLAFGPGHRLLLPASALLGATLLVSADLLSRTLVAPAELPIGIVTAIFGGPFFLWLLARSRGVL